MRGPTPAIEKVARVIVLIASVWFAFTAFWGLFSIPGGGHLGAGSAGNLVAWLRRHTVILRPCVQSQQERLNSLQQGVVQIPCNSLALRVTAPRPSSTQENPRGFRSTQGRPTWN